MNPSTPTATPRPAKAGQLDHRKPVVVAEAPAGGTSGVDRMWKSSIGLKWLVAVTGVILLLFVIGHMVGNLQIYLGQDALNTYAEKLRAFPPLLYLIRAAMLIIAVVHIFATISLALLNRRARPVAYVKQTPVEATVFSRTMVYSGLTVLAFVIYHLLHFTWRATNPEYSALLDMHGRFDVYTMVVMGFQNVAISVAYIVGIVLLGFHLNHAIASMFQTVGWSTPRTREMLEKVAALIAVIIVIGNLSMPISVLLGLVKLPTGGM